MLYISECNTHISAKTFLLPNHPDLCVVFPRIICRRVKTWLLWSLIIYKFESATWVAFYSSPRKFSSNFSHFFQQSSTPRLLLATSAAECVWQKSVPVVRMSPLSSSRQVSMTVIKECRRHCHHKNTLYAQLLKQLLPVSHMLRPEHRNAPTAIISLLIHSFASKWM